MGHSRRQSRQTDFGRAMYITLGVLLALFLAFVVLPVTGCVICAGGCMAVASRPMSDGTDDPSRKNWR